MLPIIGAALARVIRPIETTKMGQTGSEPDPQGQGYSRQDKKDRPKDEAAHAPPEASTSQPASERPKLRLVVPEEQDPIESQSPDTKGQDTELCAEANVEPITQAATDARSISETLAQVVGFLRSGHASLTRWLGAQSYLVALRTQRKGSRRRGALVDHKAE